MRFMLVLVMFLLVSLPLRLVWADELTQIVQQDLTTLGYDTGGTDGVIKAAISKGDSAGKVAQPAVATSAPAAPGETEADLRARQQACLQERAAAARRNAEVKRGFGKLLSAVSRTTSRYGSGDTASTISSGTGEVNSASATMNDLEGAAEDLGLSGSDVDACRNP